MSILLFLRYTHKHCKLYSRISFIKNVISKQTTDIKCFGNTGTRCPWRHKLRPDDHIMTAQDDSVQLKAGWAKRLKLPKSLDHRDSATTCSLGRRQNIIQLYQPSEHRQSYTKVVDIPEGKWSHSQLICTAELSLQSCSPKYLHWPKRGLFFFFNSGKSSFSFGLVLKTDLHPSDIYIKVY